MYMQLGTFQTPRPARGLLCTGAALLGLAVLHPLTARRPSVSTPSIKVVGAASSTPAVTAEQMASYGRLPLAFESNQGQTDKQVQFLSRGAGYNLFLTPTEAVLSLHSAQPNHTALGRRTSFSRNKV